MNHHDTADFFVRLQANVSLKAETARLLAEMADDMEISISEVLSFLAEDAVIDLKRGNSYIEKIRIPNKCSKEDLINALNKNSIED